MSSHLTRPLALALVLSLTACAGQAKAPAPQASPTAPPARATVAITLVGTSDLHGRLAALPLLGGALSAIRARNPDGVVLLDAGDMFQGTLESNLGEGAAVIEAYKKLGYDAVTIGNHEFDYGPVGEASTVRKGAKEGPDRDARGALKARAAQAQGSFPFLAANLLEDDHPLAWPNVLPSALITRHGVSVGLIGVTTTATTATTIAANVVGIRVTPLSDAITAQARALRDKGAKLVFVAAHAGGECTRFDVPTDLSSCDASAEIFEVARALVPGTVQAIVAGHSHKSIAQEAFGTPIIQSGAYGAAVGQVDFVVDAATGKLLRTTIHAPAPVTRGAVFAGAAIEPEPDVEEAIAPAIERARARRAEGLATTLAGPFLAKYHEESALGNLITSLLLDLEPKADIALSNGGGLRADLPAGPLSYGELYDAFPFDNRLARLTMTGRMLRDAFTKNLTGKGGILSIAGARVTGRCEGGKLAVDIVLTGKKAERKLTDEDRVVIVTNEFLATRGDDFGPGEQVVIDEDGPPFRDPVAALLKKRGGTLKPEEWLNPAKPRLTLPGPVGAAICGPRP